MNRRLIEWSACGALLVLMALPGSAFASDRQTLSRLEEVTRAADRGKAVDRSELRSLLREMEQSDARQKRAFTEVAAKPLPASARERLQNARAAYDAGQGRALELVRALSGMPGEDGLNRKSGATIAADTLAAVAELRALTLKIEQASRPQPRSALLNVRPPSLAPSPQRPQNATPILETNQDVQSDNALNGPVGNVPELLKQRAAQLQGPLEIYDFVRQNIRPELYDGAMKGPVQTLLEGGGNDADTSALLVGLLRAKGLEARFVRGQVELTAESVRAHSGTATIELALRALDHAGIPHESIPGLGGITLVRWQRTWVEAYIPYVNYRGAQLDAHGKAWVPLDANWKPFASSEGVDIAESLGFDAWDTMNRYLESSDRRSPTRFIREEVETRLSSQRPDLSYAQLIRPRPFLAPSLGLLPSTLPFKVIGRPDGFLDLPTSTVHTVRVVGESADGRTLFTATRPIASILGKRFTLSYQPFSADDATVVRQFGGMDRTPPFLFDVRPILKIGGVAVAAGDAPIGMAVKYALRLEFDAPSAHDVVTNTVAAGNMVAIGLGGRVVTGAEEAESKAAEILSARAWSYLSRWNEADGELAALLGVSPIRPTVSACMVSSDFESEFAGGDPLFPLDFQWKGIAIDADLRSTAPSAMRTAEREKDFLLLSGLVGSVLENLVFEDDLQIESISTAKGLQIARELGVPLVDIDGTNAGDILPTLPLDPTVREEIELAISQGSRVRVPTQIISYVSWRGTPYLVINDQSGATGWQLQGGHEGGVTVLAPVDIPVSISDPLISQREGQAPSDVFVAGIQRFMSTDFQLGIVGKAAAIPLKVLATDAEGFAVPGAPLTFQAIGGGGSFLDPITGLPIEGEVTVLSNDRGEAAVTFIYGVSTKLIPRFLRKVGDVESTQVGLNLVTVRSGRVTLDETFTLWGEPDGQFDGASYRFYPSWNVSQSTSDDGRLGIAAYFTTNISDQHGNPLSNIPVLMRYVPVPEQLPPPEGWFHPSGPTTTPATLLNLNDYGACLQTISDPLRGECAGEASEITQVSGPFGVGAVVFLGDSPYSIYTFELGSATTPRALVLEVGSGATFCRPAGCASGLHPDPPKVEFTHRPLRSNRSGDAIEAYPPGGVAQMDFTATSYEEDVIAVPVIDGSGNVHFRARGLRTWKRRRLTDAEFSIDAESNITRASPSRITYDGQKFRTAITLTGSPQLNSVKYSAKMYPGEIRYLSETFADGARLLDPAFVDANTGQILRQRNLIPIEGKDSLDLWAVTAELRDLDPSPVLLTAADTLAYDTHVSPFIQPAAYRSLLTSNDVSFDISRVKSGSSPRKVVLQGNGINPYVVPAGLSFPPADYEGSLKIVSVASTATVIDILSPPLPIPACRLLTLNTREVEINLVRDPLNETTCGGDEPVVFTLCHDALVTLKVQDQIISGRIDSGEAQLARDLPLAAGVHRIYLPSTILQPSLRERSTLSIRAVASGNPALAVEATGVVVNRVITEAALPVGHTFVKGIDLFDGHLAQQAGDLSARGRHLGLEVMRTYSSAGRSGSGLLGAGWSFNYESRLQVTSCAVVVRTPDGGGQSFTPLQGGGYRPQRGYHAKLRKNGDGTFDFIDKAGIIHHFAGPEDVAQPLGPRRLEFIREPHGDELRFVYSGAGRLTSVEEHHPESVTAVRTLAITYQSERDSSTGFPRIAKIEILPHGTSAEYAYDAAGNLTKATTSTGLTWTYEYSVSNERDKHQMLAVVDPNGARTAYVYSDRLDTFPGETLARDGVTVVEEKEEFVHRVREYPLKGSLQGQIETEFRYDYSGALGGEYKTTTRDPVGHQSAYSMNSNGGVVQIDEPEGRTTKATWQAGDILKSSETDANGRLTEYQYDDNGNRTLERIHTVDVGLVETAYEYHPTFNRPTLMRDPLGRETRYEIDSQTGDLLSQTNALLDTTVNVYDGHGQLTSYRDPRGNTTILRDHNSYGDPREIEDPLQNRTTRIYDVRGRVTDESDTSGRSRTMEYDEQDRVLRQIRRAGGPSGNLDEITQKTYYPGGQTETETNANGGVTRYVLDGMGRVVRTETPSGVVATAWFDDGPKASETDRRGVGRTFAYDGVHRLKSVVITTATNTTPGPATEGPMGAVASFEYDKHGNKTHAVDHAGRVTRFLYDGLYRVKQTFLPQAPYEIRSIFDKVGNQTSAFDANGFETRSTYDALNRVTSVRRDPDGLNLTSATEYNDAGTGTHVNKSAEMDVTRGIRTEFRYDELNREIERKTILQGEDGDPLTNSVTYLTSTDYADTLHRVSVTDARGTVIESSMDGLDRVTSRSIRGVCTAGEASCAAGTPVDLTTAMVYDGSSNKIQETDPAGRIHSWVYDEQSRLTEARDFAGAIVYGYDGEGLKISETDRRRVRKAFTHDNLARPRTESLATTQFSGRPWSREIRYLEDPGDWRRVEKDARGYETTFQLDGMGRVLKVMDPDGFFAQTAWDGVNKRVELDKRGNLTRMVYDAADRLVETQDPSPFSGQFVRTLFDDSHSRKTETDRRGLVTVSQMDALGRSVSVTRSGVRLEKNAYDENSNKVLGEDAEGKKTAFAYDRANRLVARTDGASSPDVAVTTFVMDGSGNKTAEIDPRSTNLEPSMRYVYDGANRQTDAFNGEGDRTHTEYDAEGNRISVTPPAHPATTYTWDELGKLLSVTQPATEDHAAAVTAIGYDENRNKTSQTNARGFATTYTYDKLNRLKSMTEPAVTPAGPLVTTFVYDPNGNATLITDPKNQTETTTFDELNRKAKSVYGEAPGTPSTAWREARETRYEYDENNNPTGAHEYVTSGTDPPNTPPMIRSVIKVFDSLDRQESETTTLPDGGTKTVGYEYFLNGTRKTVIDPNGVRTAYTYDGKNRVATTTTNADTAQAATTVNTYFADDLLKDSSDPNGVKEDRTYDKADRLKTLTNTKGATVVSRYEYGYDANGNRISQVETNPSVTPAEAGVHSPELTTYTYDEANRLKTVTYPADSTYPFGRLVTYHYDKTGNREREVETVPATASQNAGAQIIQRTGTFDANNRLTHLVTTAGAPTVPPSVIASSPALEDLRSNLLVFEYDANGNESERTRTLTPADGGTVTTTLSTWDLKDHLAEQTKDGQIITRHEYDAEGRRTKKIGEEGIRQYVYDDTSLLTEYDATGLEVAKYDYGADRLIRLTRADEGTRYMTFDGLGSVTGLTNLSGDVTATYHLDAWGSYRFTTELTPSHNRFGFTGHYWDREASLYYAKARYYDPFTARFTQSDSFLGSIDDPPSLHRYQYANANPTFYTDPTGHDAVSLAQAAARGEALDYVKEQATRGLAEAGRATKEWLGDVGMSLSIGAARTLSMQIDPETGEISALSPGHNPTKKYESGVPQPQNTTERLGADITDLVITAAPLMGNRLRDVSPAKVDASVNGSRPLGATQAVTIVEGKSGGTFALSETNRPIYAGGKLKSKPAPRDLKSQAQLPGKAPGDHAGHMLASRFGFEGEGFNLTPMAPKLNLSGFKKLENLWGRLEKQGHEVEVHVFAVHKTNPNRADQFAVAYSVDGGQLVMTVLNNPLPKAGKTSSSGATVH